MRSESARFSRTTKLRRRRRLSPKTKRHSKIHPRPSWRFRTGSCPRCRELIAAQGKRESRWTVRSAVLPAAVGGRRGPSSFKESAPQTSEAISIRALLHDLTATRHPFFLSLVAIASGLPKSVLWHTSSPAQLSEAHCERSSLACRRAMAESSCPPRSRAISLRRSLLSSRSTRVTARFFSRTLRTA